MVALREVELRQQQKHGWGATTHTPLRGGDNPELHLEANVQAPFGRVKHLADGSRVAEHLRRFHVTDTVDAEDACGRASEGRHTHHASWRNVNVLVKPDVDLQGSWHVVASASTAAAAASRGNGHGDEAIH